MERDGIVFPYGITLSDAGSVHVFPTAEVSFFTPSKERISLFLLVDSGATISALPKSDAVVFGLIPDEGTPMAVGGIHGGVIMGRRHDVNIEIDGIALCIPFVLLPHDDAPRVLGRTGIFDQYTVVFEESKRRSGFLHPSSNVAKRISDSMDKFTT